MLLDNFEEQLLEKAIKPKAQDFKTKVEYETRVTISETGKPVDITQGEPEVSIKEISIPISFGSEYDKNLYNEYIYPNAMKR